MEEGVYDTPHKEVEERKKEETRHEGPKRQSTSKTPGGSSKTPAHKFARRATLRLDEGETLSRDSFDFIRKLGDGAYGQVYMVRSKKNGMIYGLKELCKDHILKHNKQHSVFRERDLLEQVCDHKNIVSYECTFQDQTNLYFLLEFAENGSLSQQLKAREKLPYEACKFIIAEIVLALEFMH